MKTELIDFLRMKIELNKFFHKEKSIDDTTLQFKD